MNKREFLAAGGAVPLILAGCGGNGSGNAPVRLVNASVGYPNLGFMDESTQATSADAAYGSASPFENVQAGAVGITLTVAGQAATASQVRTINKDQRYSLVAYGFANELKSVLLTESTVTPDAGKANVNVLNTSVDIGAVDVYLSASKDLAVSTLIASSIPGVQQSAFAGILAGSYYITVVGANSIAKGISDVRFQTPSAIVLTALEVLTIILTPGASGVLANVILLTQGTAGAASPTTPYFNLTARVRAVTSVNGLHASVTGTNTTTSTTGTTNTSVTILADSTTSLYSNYFVVNTGTPPVVLVGGTAVPVIMDVTTTNATTGVVTVTPDQPGALAAGGDYTLLVYLNGSTPTARLIEDNNTAAVTSSGVKFRLINLASNNQGLQLSMAVNSISVASNIGFAKASAYTEVTGVPQNTQSLLEVSNGPTVLATKAQVYQVGNIFTAITVSVPDATTSTGVQNFVLSSSGTS
ncbi:MAG: DUF4397 domain-containing protein [Caulobacter sp.]|nr:DUF4397 domain-containing protein [Vitreoscilla sp.]